MKEYTQFQNHHVEIQRRPRQRFIRLRVKSDGGLRITCARGTPKSEILHFIRESEGFISKSLRSLSEHRSKYPPKIFESGESFLYLGERRSLQIVWSWDPRIRFQPNENELEMVAPLASTREDRQAAVMRYYQNFGRGYLRDRLTVHAEAMELWPKTVSIRGQTTRWGSCSAKGEVSLNWKLMAAPEAVIDYVIVHELAHLRHLNHSARFWELVAKHFPAYGNAKKWLRQHEAEIAAQFLEAP